MMEKYKDIVAALAMQHNVNKGQCTSIPFIKEFEYGASNEGYGHTSILHAKWRITSI